MTFSIAIAGKGGTGKTTLSALLVRALREAGKQPILAVDADPNSNLAEALGVVPGRPLAEIREQGTTPESSPASGVGRVRTVEDEIHRAVAEAEGFDVVTMGWPEGPRCYCAVNNLLRKSLNELSRSYAAVVVDNEAGMEHLSRRTTNDVDVLIVVMNTTLPSIRAAQRILELSRQLPVQIARCVALVNRVGSHQATEVVERELAAFQVERMPDVPQDDDVESAGAVDQNVFHLGENSPALAAVRGIVQILLSAATNPNSPCLGEQPKHCSVPNKNKV